MPNQKFALEPGGAKRLEVSWSMFWKNFTVKVDGAVVATADGSAQLKQGVRGNLPDGRAISARLKTDFGNQGLELLLDGKPLPGSSGDPVQQIKIAGGIVFFLAGVNFLLGILGFVVENEFLQSFGFAGIIMGLIFAVLGFFTLKHSRIALGMAMGIYILDGVATFAMAATEGGRTNFGGIFMRVIFLLAMGRAFKAMGDLKARATTQISPTP